MKSLGVLQAVVIASLSGYKKVYFDEGTFICEGFKAIPTSMYIPAGFWKDVRQLYFTLQNEDYTKVCRFFEQYGIIPIEDELKKSNQFFKSSQEYSHVSLKTINIALEYFINLSALFDNSINGKMDYVREVLGGGTRYDQPWSANLPKDGYKPYLFIYDQPYQSDGFYRLVDDDKLLRKDVNRVILNEVKEWLQEIPWEIVTFELTRNSISHAWGFHANNWMQAAIASWYIEKIAALNLCVCGCEQPARPGSKYANNKCAQNYRQRKIRDKKTNTCPTCGQILQDSEIKRRVAQKITPKKIKEGTK